MKIRQLYGLAACTALLLTLAACEKLDEPRKASENRINALKCYVYYDAADWSRKAEVDVLSGIYNAGKGVVSYTFPDDDTRYTPETLARCRLEVSIPSTARLEETDAAGESTGGGIGGLRNLYNRTVYFRVTAADGSAMNYQVTFRLKK